MNKYNNYIILSLILLGTIVVLLYALQWHAVYEEQIGSRASIVNYISEVNVEEYNNYIVDNRDSVIYFGIADDIDCKKFETELKKVIQEYQLRDKIVYINVAGLNGDKLGENLDKKYSNAEMRSQNKKFTTIPSIGIYRNAVLVDFIAGDSLARKTVIAFLKKYEVIEEMGYNLD